MNQVLRAVEERLMAGEDRLVSTEEAVTIATLPAADSADIMALASLVRARRVHRPVFTCAIINAKSGRCPENCAFCAQSASHHTNAPIYPLVDTDTLLRAAEDMAAHGVNRFGIVTSGTTVSDRDLDRLCESARCIREKVDIALCGSLGIMTAEKMQRLLEAGFSSYHHNLETARSYFPRICSSHTYDQDVETLAIAKKAGMRVCSCGIFGLGESWAQRVELLETVRESHVDSLPLNFLVPIPGTRMEKQVPPSGPEALRVIALARFLNPGQDILVCGGRTSVFGPRGGWIFAAGASGVMTGDYLTTPGAGYDEDNEMLRFLGLRG